MSKVKENIYELNREIIKQLKEIMFNGRNSGNLFYLTRTSENNRKVVSYFVEDAKLILDFLENVPL